MPKLFIAAGHGGTDPGAVSSSNIERDIAIAVVDKAFQLCLAQNKNGFELVKVPHALGLVDGIHWINANITNVNTDECVEVHLNSNAGTAGTGTETYYGMPDLATEVHQEVVKVLGLRDRGVKDGNIFMFNNSTNCMSCLVELGFINNPTDAVAVIQRGGLALAKGMIRACNSTWTEPVVPPPAPVITTKTETVTTAIPFTKTTIQDPTKTGTSITTIGIDGSRVVTYSVTYTDGKETKRTVTSDITKQPVVEVTTIGTYVPPVTPPTEPPIVVLPVEGIWQRFWAWVFSIITKKKG